MKTLDRTELFERLPVPEAVRRQIIPSIASQMVALIYNLADTYFVGLLNKPGETAAVSVAFPLLLMVTAISNLFGVGGASVISRALGKKDTEKARAVSSLSIWYGLICSLVYGIIVLFFRRPLLLLCGATDVNIESAMRYTLWVSAIGAPVTLMSTLLANLIRAEGSARVASLGLSIGGIANILMDPLFVLPRFLGMEASGAGLATMLSNALTILYFVHYLNGKETILKVGLSYFNAGKAYLTDVLKIGFPSALQYALTVVTVAAQGHFISAYEEEAVAGWGIVRKLDNLPLYFSIGVANGLLPLLAYNHSAGNRERQKAVFKRGCLISLGFALFCVVLYESFAPQLSRIFIKDAATIAYSAAFLRRMVIAMPLMSLCYPLIIQFQAMGCAKESLICSVLRKGMLDIPLLFLMDRLIPLYGIMWVQPIVDLTSLIVALAFTRKIAAKTV